MLAGVLYIGLLRGVVYYKPLKQAWQPEALNATDRQYKCRASKPKK